MYRHFCEAIFFVKTDPEVPKREIEMCEIEEIWQPAKFYCSKIELIHSRSLFMKLSLTCRICKPQNMMCLTIGKYNLYKHDKN